MADVAVCDTITVERNDGSVYRKEIYLFYHIHFAEENGTKFEFLGPPLIRQNCTPDLRCAIFIVNTMTHLRTLIETDKKALRHNVEQFLKLIPQSTRFMAVVKSNAYGHGLITIAKELTALNPKPYTLNSRLWFGVDSIVEALRLRKEKIKHPILVLGSTLPSRIKDAYRENIILTISNFESLKELAKLKYKPDFHIKIDTGMHRQGFLPEDALKLLKLLKNFQLAPAGVYTHFASAKDAAYPTYTLEQLRKFNAVVSELKTAGFKNLIRHAAASGGTLLFPKSHLDMVRVGIGLYGYFPSPESKIAASVMAKNDGRQTTSFVLKPILTWKTLVSEVKEIPAGSFVGYDLSEMVTRKTKIAILPVGYWHGYDRGLSSIGEVLIRGKRRKVIGKVSMDMTIVDVTDPPKVRVGDEVTLIGRQGKDAIWADELALKVGTTHYEFLTRINPLIKRL